jgi:hypothetical protein
VGFRLLASWVGFAVLGAFAFLALTPLVPLLPRVVLGVVLAWVAWRIGRSIRAMD